MAIRVDDAEFEFMAQPPSPQWVMRVTVNGEGFEQRAVPVAARVGEEAVEGIVIDLDRGGFAGYLRREPAAGSQLRVGYLDDLTDTDIEYEPPVG